MLNDLHILGIRAKYVSLIEATLAGSKAGVKVNVELTNAVSYTHLDVYKRQVLQYI